MCLQNGRICPQRQMGDLPLHRDLAVELSEARSLSAARAAAIAAEMPATSPALKPHAPSAEN